MQLHTRARRKCCERDSVEVHDVRGEARKVALDRLRVADIGEDAAEERQPRLLRRHRHSGLRHQREKSDGLQRYGLSSGVGSADDQLPRRIGKGNGEWDRRRCFAAPSAGLGDHAQLKQRVSRGSER
jgi:hypothetical protein